jgi:hypothetical protein
MHVQVKLNYVNSTIFCYLYLLQKVVLSSKICFSLILTAHLITKVPLVGPFRVIMNRVNSMENPLKLLKGISI